MGDVHLMPGVLRADLEIGTLPGAVLQSAMDAGLKDVAVVGRGVDGSLTVWGSHPDADITVALLVRGCQWLAAAAQVPMPPEPEAG